MKYVAALAGILAVSTGCNDVAGPAGAKIDLSGIPQITDTITAVVAEPIRFQVRDASGRPAANTWVLLTPGPTNEPGESTGDATPRVFLTLPGQARGQLHPAVFALFEGRLWATYEDAVQTSPDSPASPDSRRVLTDRWGSAVAYARLGYRAGDAYLTATIDGYRDSVLVRVLPGAPVGLAALPADTAIVAGDSYALEVFEIDRIQNRREGDAEAIIVSSEPELAQTDGSTIHALAPGRVTLDLTSPVGSGQVHISVVPDGVLAMGAPAWPENGNPALTTTDGVSVQAVPAAAGLSCPAWHPDGERLLFEGLSIVTPAGDLSRVPLDRQDIIAGCGRFSADGEWIYFDGRLESDPADASEVWRVRPDGTSLEQITFSNGTPAWGASSSPDGSRIVYSAGRHGYAVPVTLVVLDLASGVADTIIRAEPFSSGNRHGVRAVWSPTGEWIAYTHFAGDDSYRHEDRSHILLDRIALIRPDGSGNHDLPNTRVRANDGVSWSPDGEWVVAAGDEHNPRVKIYNIADPRALPLNRSTEGFRQPAWRP